MGGPPIEAALISQCGVLALLSCSFACASGPRRHARKVAELGVDGLSLEVMRRYANHRNVACAALLLLGAVVHDDAASTRFEASAENSVTVAAVKKQWPSLVEEAIRTAPYPLARPVLRSLKLS